MFQWSSLLRKFVMHGLSCVIALIYIYQTQHSLLWDARTKEQHMTFDNEISNIPGWLKKSDFNLKQNCPVHTCPSSLITVFYIVFLIKQYSTFRVKTSFTTYSGLRRKIEWVSIIVLKGNLSVIMKKRMSQNILFIGSSKRL